MVEYVLRKDEIRVQFAAGPLSNLFTIVNLKKAFTSELKFKIYRRKFLKKKF